MSFVTGHFKWLYFSLLSLLFLAQYTFCNFYLVIFFCLSSNTGAMPRYALTQSLLLFYSFILKCHEGIISKYALSKGKFVWKCSKKCYEQNIFAVYICTYIKCLWIFSVKFSFVVWLFKEKDLIAILISELKFNASRYFIFITILICFSIF